LHIFIGIVNLFSDGQT